MLIRSTHLNKKKKIDTIKWRRIYEVIEEAYFKVSENFPDDFIKQCRDNENEAQCIPLKIKRDIKQMAMLIGIYAQVVKLS